MSRSEVHVVLCTDGVFPHAFGGMQRHSRLLAEHLAQHEGLRLTVIHPHKLKVFAPELGITEVPVAPIDERRFYLNELYRYSGRVAAVLRELAPDVILSQGFCMWKDIGEFRDRLIVHPHGLEMFQGLTWKDRLIGAPFRSVLRRIVANAAVTISLGGKLTPLLQEMAARGKGRVVVLPNAVEVPGALAAYPSADGPLRILFVGRFAFNKGIDVLLSVAERLMRGGRGELFQFTLAGDGPERARMEREGLPRNVELAGKVDDAQLNALYAHCHALLLPTRFEGMPTVVLEAMARARPVLVSDVGASAELVGPDNGFLIPPGNADALYDALLKFGSLSNDERSSMGESGFTRVRSRFSWPAVTEDFVALFEEVARKAH